MAAFCAAGTREAPVLCVDKDTSPADYTELVRAVLAAVRDGRLPEERLAEAAARVAAFTGRQRALAADTGPLDVDPLIGLRAARRAVRVLRAEPGALPFPGAPHIVEIGCTLRSRIPGATRETLDPGPPPRSVRHHPPTAPCWSRSATPTATRQPQHRRRPC